MNALESARIIGEQPIRRIIIELQLIMVRAERRQTAQQRRDRSIGKRLLLFRNQPHHRHKTDVSCVGRWKIESRFPMPGLSGVLQFAGLPVNRIDFLRL
jgi:hypothetical protein